MCGIAGILSFDGSSAAEPQEQRIARMQEALSRRGPDGSGRRVEGPCTLAHTRLAVLDKTGGAQPMRAKSCPSCAGLAIVFNGEIYNHRQLRSELEALGHRFDSHHCDTEVLLHGFRQWGEKLPQKLEGMFAFAIWDSSARRLHLSRDRTGKKPLYIHRGPGELAFASTPAALLRGAPHGMGLNRGALADYLTFGFTFHRTLLAGVEELAPASWLSCDVHGRITEGIFWRPPNPDRAPAAQATPAAVESHLEHLLHEAVGRRLEADVPLGCFLSGGLDSSLVAAFAQEELFRRGERLSTFTVSMPQVHYDEGPFALRVADHLNCEHHQLRAEPKLEEDLSALLAGMGEPLADSSILPTYWISRAARQRVTVALTGDGGDELFAGYDRYAAMRLLARWSGCLAWLPPPRAGDPKSFSARLARLIEAARQPTAARSYLSIIRLFSPALLSRMGLDDLPEHNELPGWLADPLAGGAESARRWDFSNHLPFDLLRKVDRASMAVALEVRCPMLDTSLVESALRLPVDDLMAGGRSKALLRRIAARRLPRDIVQRKKMGFAIPLGTWFAGPLRGLLEKHLLDGPHLTGLGLRRDVLEWLIGRHATGKSDHTHRLYALLALAIWLWDSGP